MLRPARIVADRGGRILAFSDALLDLCEMRPDRAPPTQLRELMPDLLTARPWGELFEGRSSRLSTVTRLSLASGPLIDVSIEARLVIDDGGRAPIVVLSVTPLERKARAARHHERRPRPPLSRSGPVARRRRRHPTRRARHQRRPGLRLRSPKGG